MEAFYKELAVRVLGLANALQYDNAASLLILAISASDDPAPDELMDAWTDFRFYQNLNSRGGREGFTKDPHDFLESAVAHIEKYLAKEA